jgi:hypothetical protein
LLSVILMAGGTGQVWAGLKFEKTLAEHKAKAEDDAFKVLFPFVNEGDRAVTIVKIESSCGCLKAESDKQVIPAGEAGVITGIFNLGAAPGANEKMLTIKTDEGGDPYELVTRIIVPEVVSIEPKILSWEIGAEAKAKEFLVTMKHEKPIRVLQVTCSRAEFGCEVETIEEGKQYRLTLTPETTAKPVLGVLRIETDCEIEKHRRQMAFFSVKRGAAE